MDLDENVNSYNDGVSRLSRKKSKKVQRTLIWMCWLMYTLSQLGRYSYASNVNPIMARYGISHATASLPATLFFFAYGAGQLVNAFLCKYFDKKRVLCFVMLVSGGINLTLFFGVPFVAIEVLWFFNGVAQSVLWCSLISVIGENTDEDMLSRSSFIMSTAPFAG